MTKTPENKKHLAAALHEILGTMKPYLTEAKYKRLRALANQGYLYAFQLQLNNHEKEEYAEVLLRLEEKDLAELKNQP